MRILGRNGKQLDFIPNGGVLLFGVQQFSLFWAFSLICWTCEASPLGKNWACFNTYCQKEWLCRPHRRAECGLQSKHCCIPYWLPPRISSSQDYFHRNKHNPIPCLQTLTTKMHKEGRNSIWRSDSRRLFEQESWQQDLCVLEKYDYSEESPQAVFVWAVRMLLKIGGKMEWRAPWHSQLQ